MIEKYAGNNRSFFFPFVYAERKFYEFFTVVHLTRVSSAMAWPLWEISTLETSRCNSISSLWKRMYWLTNAFRCLLPLVRKLWGSRFVRSRWIFAFFQSNFWILEPNSCCCVLSMARELASIGRLLTKKYALTERDENLDRFCSKAFFVSIIRYWKYSGISSMTILGNFFGICTSWSPYFDYNKLKIGRKVWTKSHRSSRGEKI